MRNSILNHDLISLIFDLPKSDAKAIKAVENCGQFYLMISRTERDVEITAKVTKQTITLILQH
jgi:hypothetical protein